MHQVHTSAGATAPRNAALAAAGLILLHLFPGCATRPGVTPVTAAGADSIRRASPARVVLLNVWATWCKPCLDEMPGLVRLRSEYSRDDLDLIMLSADDLSDLDSAVVPFLAKTGVDFRTYIFAGGDQDAFISAIDTGWSGALPATFISARSSGVARRHVGERSYDQLRREVDALLAGEGPR